MIGKNTITSCLLLVVSLSSFVNTAYGDEQDGMVDSVSRVDQGSDYTFMWWAHGWRGERVRCVQTNTYGLAMDVQTVAVTHFGEINNPLPYVQAVSQGNEVIFNLPPAKLELIVEVGRDKYTCVSGRHPRMVESGRFLQRGDIEDLVFQDSAGTPLPAGGRLEIIAWPDRLAFLLEIVPREDLSNCRAVIRFSAGDRVVEQVGIVGNWPGNASQAVHAVVFPGTPETAPSKDLVQAFEAQSGKAVPVVYDPVRGWHGITMPDRRIKRIPSKAYLDRIHLRLNNPGGTPKVVRLMLADGDGVPGITGVVPMLRDMQGHPTGLDVQVSKNWHRKETAPTLYDGLWLRALTHIRLAPQAVVDLEYGRAINKWGKVPLASHAQLCLIGWGTDQLWDQAAIGSWGESICYDPDICLNRSMIDDMRPLMVTAMNSKDGKWTWTNNVGGGDFLVYVGTDGQRRFLSRMRTAYLSHGPNLTEVVYSGISSDGHINATMRVMTPRCDDLNRAYHYFRYDVVKPTPFSRLAFYQVGADKYNDHQFRKLARGDETGLLEEWPAPQGGLTYHREGISCGGKVPWFSLHEGISKDEEGGAWANRGLVIRYWQARLAGREAPPVAACYGTEDKRSNKQGPDSCNIELTAPSDVTLLQPGDYVEAWVELLVLPQFAKDYYGPNKGLRKDLEANENTWKPVFRQAVGNDMQIVVKKGRLLRAYPPHVEVDASGNAELSLTGGLGYVPLTFAGLDDYRGGELAMLGEDGAWSVIDQSSGYRNDFWQIGRDESGKYAITFNVDLDAPERLARKPRVFRYSRVATRSTSSMLVKPSSTF
ncbi:MAG: hypothetical protein GXY44_03870 [Phycisphaerales bacterium]|nr:hypothetical protein [Phycisphaerales bacterium]